MKGETLENIFIPQAGGYLQVPTVQEGQYIDVCCCYSLEFTSNLLSDNNVLCSNKFCKEYCGQSMLNFFEPEEEIPEDKQE